jgi:hypothetical protein
MKPRKGSVADQAQEERRPWWQADAKMAARGRLGSGRCIKRANHQEHFETFRKNSTTFSKTARERQVVWRTN